MERPVSLDRTMSVAQLLTDCPWARQVLDWHGISTNDVDERWSLATVCLLHHLDEARVMRDLEQVSRAYGDPLGS